MASAADMRAVVTLLAAQPHPTAEVELRRQLCREAYERGLADGWHDGYEHGARLRESEWPEVVAAVLGDRLDHAELEHRRWGPEGRERFGEPRPGDRLPRLEAAS